MKNWLIITVLLLCLVLVGTAACNPFGGSEGEANQQLVEVMRGNLAVTVNGIGNIAISEERMLSFGSSGKVEKVYIEEGDEASKGDLLAKLDTDALELALAQAKVALTKQQVALTKQQVAITQAQVDIETAEFNMYEAQDQYVWQDLRTAQADVDEARRYLDDALSNLNQATPGIPKEFLQKVVIHAQSRLDTAEDKLKAMLAGTDPQEVVIKRLEVELAQQSLELAQQSLEQEQQSLEEAQQSLKQAQKQLDEATLTALFDGIVASVYVDEGDSVVATTAIIHLVDLNTLELIVEVDEIDMPSVKLGQKAIISVDALPGVELEGEVTFIPPEAKEKTGLVLYDVEIGFDVPQDLGLKGGMSATADIVTAERSNVLLVPNQAITLDNQGNPVVMVMVEELIKERKVVTGIGSGSHTEILDGLDEGEVVVVAIKR